MVVQAQLDVLSKTDEEFFQLWESRLYPYMERMITEARKVLPDAVFGVELIPKGSWSQDAFGKNYGCLQSRRRWLINADLLNRKYMEHAPKLGYMIIPDYHNCNGDVNYPVTEEAAFASSPVTVTRSSNALHATADGYSQWADCEYFFLKYLLAQGLVK